MLVQTLLRQTLFASAVIFGSCNWAASAEIPTAAGITPLTASMPLASQAQFKREPRSLELYQFDDTALGQRLPLLLVHGVRGELWRDCFRWQKLCTYLTANNQFNSRYKIYLARYDSYQPLDTSVKQFTSVLPEFSHQLGGKPFTIVALSIGGNLVAQSMADDAVAKSVRRVITLGTPFHGSPLFTSPWMDYTMVKWHKTPLTSLDTALPYDIYFAHHKNLLSALSWDNADGLLPDRGNFRLWYKPLHARVLNAAACANARLLDLNAGTQIDKSKFITYGGFLSSDVAIRQPKSAFRRALKAPVWFTTTVLPEHLGKEHAVLRSLNQLIAHASRQPNGFAYGLNDGITPLNSSLFLRNQSMEKWPCLASDQVGAIGNLVDVGKARVFANIDHLSFIDEYRPRGGTDDVRDELEPRSAPRPLFSWLLGDLLEGGVDEQLSVGPKRK
jgi:hypothetical protein